ncbi:uncharacterized protein J7T54_006043 [Emericellopsis cladophorae]|uniref:Uncharacterized protein n=1 Tax=Emericellopsis cladophorae TaxID=2686198 RepID=A0A9Q0BIK0_9HYPO|nr:uncharacterized protein J7T54_006043 [Emericellopsis cladophorae]KAI6785704.1 hypothetical protein J7T54_006043 [Emericellopsis cladophorae]
MPLGLPSSTIDLHGIFAGSKVASTSTSKMANVSTRVKKAPGIRPRTRAEWKKALGDVKREYRNRRYRTCATRCEDLLDGANTLKSAEAVHLVYLHFYAATSLEMQVRSLHHASPYRLTLRDQARLHYLQAATLSESEAGSLDEDTPDLSTGDDVSTRTNSPSPTVTSSGEGACKTDRIETLVRVDSPTLGAAAKCSETACDDKEEPLCLPLARITMPGSTVSAVEERRNAMQRYASTLSALHRQIVTVHLPALDDDAAPTSRLDEEPKGVDVKSRCERLRHDGGRKRFNAARYERLREAALTDLVD